MAASYAAAVALAVALSAGLSACDKDEDPNPDAELYKPAKNINRAEILVLLKEVNANMAKVRQMSVEETRIEVITGSDKTTTYTKSITAQANLDAKKEIEMRYEDGVLDEFTYTEDNIAYEYEKHSNEPNTQESYKVSDAYWNHCEVFDDFGGITESVSEWKVEDDAFVGTVTERDATENYKVFLTSSKKISSVKYEYEYSNTEYVSREYKYTYSANPTFPKGYKKSDFPLAKQYSVKVVWNEGLGESTFYSESYHDDNDTYVYFDPTEIIRYAPKVAGKRPTLYSDSKFTKELAWYDYGGDNYYHEISLSNNDTVIYVEWVSDSGSTSKSKSKSAAKSRLFR
jgi:hypothetical protein